MSEYQVTSWRDLPSLVVAREGDTVTKSQLAPRFQEAIDEAAMRLGATDNDAYLEGWTRGDWTAAGQRARGLRPGRRGAGAAVAGRDAHRVPRRDRTCAMSTTTRLRALLGEDGTILLDGGMGTLLQEQGLDDGGSGELWNVERPEVIAGLHEEYAKAGARILTTNTFGGTRPRLEMHGLADRLHELNRAGAAIATEVAGRHGILVAGDLGPTGELLAPLGTMEPTRARELFEEQLVALRDGGIDVVLIETMSDLGEVTAAVEAARQVVPDAPVIATLSFDTNLRTMMGVRPADAVTALAALGVDAVGANCGRGPGEMAAIAEQLTRARADGVLIVAQSNAGLPQLIGDRFEYDAPPDELADHARALQRLGVDLIGACCGSTPAHTAAMGRALSG